MRSLQANVVRPAILAGAIFSAAVVLARPLGAQVGPLPGDGGGPSQSASAAYFALTVTPIGALAPSADYLLARPGAAPRPLRFGGRFASLDRGPGLGQRTWAASLDVPVAAAALSLTAGYVDVTCDDVSDPANGIDVECKGGMTLGARIGSSFFSRSLDAAGTSALVLGAELTGGYADVKALEGVLFDAPIEIGATALTASFAVPAAITVRSGNVTVAPMLAPRFAYGRGKADLSAFGADTGDDTRAGGRFMLGAGVAVRFADRIGFEAGMQKVFIDQGDTAYGLGVSVGF